MIRHATKADYPALVVFGYRFYQSMDYADIPFSSDSAMRWFDLLSARGTLLICEVDGQPVGMAAQIFGPCIFNDEYNLSQEVFWWIEPEHRKGGLGKELLEKLESAAHDAGCVRFSMISVSDHDKLRKTYGSMGLAEAERTYSKRL